MPSTSAIQQINRELAQKLNEEARSNPQSPYAGKLVGIANGQVVVVADNWNEVARCLQLAEPDPTKTFCVEPSRDYSQVVQIVELHTRDSFQST